MKKIWFLYLFDENRKSADIDNSNDGLKFPFFSLKISINHSINFYVFPLTIMVLRHIISAIL